MAATRGLRVLLGGAVVAMVLACGSGPAPTPESSEARTRPEAEARVPPAGVHSWQRGSDELRLLPGRDAVLVVRDGREIQTLDVPKLPEDRVANGLEVVDVDFDGELDLLFVHASASDPYNDIRRFYRFEADTERYVLCKNYEFDLTNIEIDPEAKRLRRVIRDYLGFKELITSFSIDGCTTTKESVLTWTRAEDGSGRAECTIDGERVWEMPGGERRPDRACP